jgi:hypothetical protein
MFDVFHVYNDPIYLKSFSETFGFMNRWDLSLIVKFPDILSRLLKLLSVLLLKHFAALSELKLLDWVLDLIAFVIRENACDGHQGWVLLNDFLKGGGVGRIEVIELLLIRSFESVANESEMMVSTIQLVIRDLLKLDVGYVAQIRELFEKAVPCAFVGALGEAFAEFDEELVNGGQKTEVAFARWLHRIRDAAQKLPFRIRLTNGI